MEEHRRHLVGRFAEKYLSPSERLTEIMFGLIMVLTITSTLSISLTEQEESREVLIVGALGCNIAWGIVDGVMFVLTGILDRGRYARLVSAIRTARSGDEAMKAIDDELDATIVSVLDEDAKRHVREDLMRSIALAEPERPRMNREDLYGAFACFLLVFVSVIPLIIPLALVPDLDLALRASNLVAVGMLFAIGYETARYTGRSRIGSGLGMVALGTVVIAVTVVLGG